MSHELYILEDGSYPIAYLAGDNPPWHAAETNPQIVPADSSIDIWMESARLNFEIGLFPNCRANGEPIEDSFHIARSDTGAIVGRFVAGDWQPVQNRVAMELAERIATKYGYKIITAGSLFNGETAWVQLETNLEAVLPGHDRIVSRPLFTLRNNGNSANTFGAVNTRVVCNNTLTRALSEKAIDHVTHDHRVELNFDAVEIALGLNTDTFGEFSEQALAMARFALSDSDSLDYFRAVMGGREKSNENGRVIHSVGVRRAMAFANGNEFKAIGQSDESDVAAYVNDRLDSIGRNVAGGLPSDVVNESPAVNPGHDMESSRGTLWGAFNTVTWLADHKPTKNRGVESNIASNLFGDGKGGQLKAKAWRKAKELLAA